MSVLAVPRRHPEHLPEPHDDLSPHVLEHVLLQHLDDRPVLPLDLCLGYVPRYDRSPPSSRRCRRRRSNRISYLEERPSARRRRRRTRPWPGCPAPCSIKGVEADSRLGRPSTPANLDLLRGPMPLSSVWKSNFGRPTPSTPAPSSLVDFHTGSRAVREIRPGHVPGVSLDEYHIFSKKTNTAVA